MSKWSKLYEKEILESNSIEEYISNKLRTKGKIIQLINKYAVNKKVMELGSGTGILALHISTLGHQVTALDMDKDMHNLSKKYFYNHFKDNNIKYVCSNILDYKSQDKFDVIYSIGILEHCTDEEIKELLNHQLDLSNIVIFGIPTKYFDEDKKMYGNERYLNLRYWRKLIKESNCTIIEETSYHYFNLWQRLINFKKYFKPNPVHVFVIKR